MSFKFALTLILSLALTGASLAQESGIKHDTLFQLGDLTITEDGYRFTETLQAMTTEVGDVSFQYKFKEKSYRLVETMHLNRFFAVEGALGYFDESRIIGTQTDTATNLLKTYDLKAKFTIFELYAQATVPIFRDYISAYVKGGGNVTRAEFKLDTTVGEIVSTGATPVTTRTLLDDNSFTMGYGYGLLGVISKTIVIRADYTKFELDQLETETSSIGIGLRY